MKDEFQKVLEERIADFELLMPNMHKHQRKVYRTVIATYKQILELYQSYDDASTDVDMIRLEDYVGKDPYKGPDKAA